MTVDTPAYRVPSMAEIAALPWNGRTVVSTFAGCGGSSLGYRMAGYRVLYANEFVPAAADSYQANAAPYTVVDRRDIRTLSAADILAATGGITPDIFDGSPPCASFSTAGKREKGWGKVKDYSDTKQRTDDLFFEYARILKELRPRVFVAENVSGLVKGTAKGYFLEILKALRESGYRVSVRLLDAKWLGVPQSRQRVIFVGVRDDLGIDPSHPAPLPYLYTVRDVLPHIQALDLGHQEWSDPDRPAASIVAMGARAGHNAQMSATYVRGPIVDGSIARGPNARIIDERPASDSAAVEQRPDAQHIDGTGQPFDLATVDISRYAIGREWDTLAPGSSSDKYFSLVRVNPDAPSPTLTALGEKWPIGAAAITHPYERRKFTIPELRRICSFPDDFVLTGTYAQQWERLGRAVPPLMMRAVAAHIRDHILTPPVDALSATQRDEQRAE